MRYCVAMKPRIHPAQLAVFEPTEQEIQHAAYLIWEEAGRPAGRDWEIWFAARERLKHRAPAHLAGHRGPASREGLSEESVRAIVAD